MAKSAIEQMLDRKRSNRFVVGFDPRDSGHVASSTDVNNGKAGSHNRVGDLASFDSGNDSVPFPTRKPIRRRIASSLFHKSNRPSGMEFASVTNDPAEQATGVGIRRFDEQSDRASLFRSHVRARRLGESGLGEFTTQKRRFLVDRPLGDLHCPVKKLNLMGEEVHGPGHSSMYAGLWLLIVLQRCPY